MKQPGPRKTRVYKSKPEASVKKASSSQKPYAYGDKINKPIAKFLFGDPDKNREAAYQRAKAKSKKK